VIDFDFSQPLEQIYQTYKEEFGYFTKEDPKEGQPNFTKNVKWSPDGLCLLSNSEDNKIRLFDLSSLAADLQQSATDDDVYLKYISSTFSVQEGGTIYDFAWYPYMNSADPTTCLFVTTSAGRPVHAWDAFTGKLRNSYSCLDSHYRPVPAYSVSFNLYGNKLFCGLNKEIQVFDTGVSAQGGQAISVLDMNKKGLNGIISCFAFHPSMPNLFVAGCYNKTIGLFDENQANLMVDMFAGHRGGVTYLRFSSDGLYLFSGARLDDSICCWDMRTGKCLYTCERKVTTNQRIQFDIDPLGKHLISGSEGGEFIIYDLQKQGEEISRFKVAQHDAVNGVSVHPYLPALTVSSGERRPVLSEEQREYPGIYVFKSKHSVQTVPIPQQQQEQQQDAMVIEQ
jgi:WD40 repeat protein